MSGHTLGPWKASESGRFISALGVVDSAPLTCAVWGVIAECANLEHNDAEGREWACAGDIKSNARLIAAAPELLEALLKYMDNDDLGARLSSPSYLAAKAAIAKATQP
jgi:hypothetical protein